LFLCLLSVFLFTGCSQKSYDVDYDKFYKDTKNSKINNSKEMHKYTMRPYSVFGIKYYPFVANMGDQFEGIASWYGPDFHEKKTSNGEVYNMYDMTAAHKTLPMNTVVKVDNLDNGKSIIVRINDRGPFVRGRIIDLSNKAAHEIDMYRKGTAQVKITVLGYNGEIENKDAPYLEVPKTAVATNQEVESNVDVLEPLEIKENNIATTTVAVMPKAIPSLDQKISKVDNKSTLSTGRYSLQIGAFSIESGAIKTKNDYQGKFKNNRVDTEKVFVNGRTLHKVFVKGFNSYEEAKSFKNMNSLTSAVIRNN
jgi:rare lipoprotein A